ncbi:uncharacterized protein METZ01_LOCUS412211, partial [marine metagenome]
FAGLGSPTRRWDDLFIYDDGFASFGGHLKDSVSLTHTAGGSAEGLVLNGTSRFYFEDGANFDQYIGSKTATAGITVIAAPAEIEIDGGILLDLDAGEVTMHAAGSDGMVIEAETGDLTINAPTASKFVKINTEEVKINDTEPAILSHTANSPSDHFTIEQKGGATASLKIASDGTGAIGVEIDADPSGVSIAGKKSSNFTVATDADAEDLTIEVTGATNSSIILESAGTGSDAIALKASAGGLDIDGVGSKINITNATDGDEDDITITTVNANNSS